MRQIERENPEPRETGEGREGGDRMEGKRKKGREKKERKGGDETRTALLNCCRSLIQDLPLKE
jgi:hypothetical protein